MVWRGLKTIIMIADGSLELAGQSDDVLARIKMIDRDCADQTRCCLLEHEGILTLADRYRVTKSNMNGVVAVADRYRVICSRKLSCVVVVHHVAIAVAEGDRVIAT